MDDDKIRKYKIGNNGTYIGALYTNHRNHIFSDGKFYHDLNGPIGFVLNDTLVEHYLKEKSWFILHHLPSIPDDLLFLFYKPNDVLYVAMHFDDLAYNLHGPMKLLEASSLDQELFLQGYESYKDQLRQYEERASIIKTQIKIRSGRILAEETEKLRNELEQKLGPKPILDL